MKVSTVSWTVVIRCYYFLGISALLVDKSALHQFGEGRAKNTFFSTIVATMLFFGGGALGVMEAIQKLLHPSHEVEKCGYCHWYF